MATHSDDWTIKFWNVEAGQEMLTFAARKAYCDTPWLFFSPDGRTLAMGSVDGGLFTRLWHALRPEEANPGKQGSPELPIRWQSRLMPSDAGGRRRIPSPVNVVLEWLPI